MDHIHVPKTKEPKKQVNIPEARRFLLTYRKKGGELKQYLVSAPIERDDKTVTVFNHQRGFRRFTIEKVVSFNEVVIKD